MLTTPTAERLESLLRALRERQAETPAPPISVAWSGTSGLPIDRHGR